MHDFLQCARPYVTILRAGCSLCLHTKNACQFYYALGVCCAAVTVAWRVYV
jgi:hypothetical protein